MKKKHLISVDEFRAAGALDVPPGWRTSLTVEREPLLGFMYDKDEPTADEPTDEEDENEDEDEEPAGDSRLENEASSTSSPPPAPDQG